MQNLSFPEQRYTVELLKHSWTNNPPPIRCTLINYLAAGTENKKISMFKGNRLWWDLIFMIYFMFVSFSLSLRERKRERERERRRPWAEAEEDEEEEEEEEAHVEAEAEEEEEEAVIGDALVRVSALVRVTALVRVIDIFLLRFLSYFFFCIPKFYFCFDNSSKNNSLFFLICRTPQKVNWIFSKWHEFEKIAFYGNENTLEIKKERKKEKERERDRDMTRLCTSHPLLVTRLCVSARLCTAFVRVIFIFFSGFFLIFLFNFMLFIFLLFHQKTVHVFWKSAERLNKWTGFS